ncbi:ModD protein [Rhodovulum sp. P5]|uniref:ModD protein n=1 Tax=Rhodovulum sp. P5 TaxID=1564506 RepID=UPI0020A4D568|nr:ModD protein [Rhodovulum sp. P5]
MLDDKALMCLLKEDVPNGDLTTRSLGIEGQKANLTMRARYPMTVCGTEEAARLFALVGAAADVSAESGTQAAAGDLLLATSGSAASLLAGWKVAQTLVEWASGVAGAAAAIVTAARAVDAGVNVACTRKAIPGTRPLSLKAVTVGGATIHRTGLSDTVLLFPEHRVFGGAGALHDQIARLRAACPERRVVVEVKSHDEALEAAKAGADVLQLEKFPPEDVAATATALGPHWPGCIAAAGGINAGNAAAYAAAGARVLVTSSPYYAKPSDVAVTIEAA